MNRALIVLKAIPFLIWCAATEAWGGLRDGWRDLKDEWRAAE